MFSAGRAASELRRERTDRVLAQTTVKGKEVCGVTFEGCRLCDEKVLLFAVMQARSARIGGSISL